MRCQRGFACSYDCLGFCSSLGFRSGLFDSRNIPEILRDVQLDSSKYRGEQIYTAVVRLWWTTKCAIGQKKWQNFVTAVEALRFYARNTNSLFNSMYSI